MHGLFGGGAHGLQVGPQLCRDFQGKCDMAVFNQDVLYPAAGNDINASGPGIHGLKGCRDLLLG